MGRNNIEGDERRRELKTLTLQKIIICSFCENTIADNLYSMFEGKVFCQLCCINNSIQKNREHTRTGQKRCAKKMLATSAKKFRDIEIGSTVLVQIPRFDRGSLDSKNLIGKFLMTHSKCFV